MDYFRVKYNGNVHFIVVSNDMEWCKTNLKETYISYSSGRFGLEVDMAILTLSDDVIMTEGTFGWWGGFLSRGEVLYYAHPVADGTTLAGKFNATEFFLPEWKPYCL